MQKLFEKSNPVARLSSAQQSRSLRLAIRLWSLRHILAKNRDRLSQALPFKSFQILGHRPGRVLQALAMIFRRCHRSPRSQVEEMKDEFVRMLRFNSKRSDGIRRKVPKVYRHDDAYMAANRSQHVPVIWIGELQTRNQILVACHERIDSVLVHQYASAFQLVARKVRALLKQTGNPFLVDVRRPLLHETAQ